jgi:hypothetical protein
LSTFVKSEDIVSASGLRIVVQDYYCNQVLASTEDLLSTSGWRELLADFATRPQTRLIATFSAPLGLRVSLNDQG